MTSDNTIREKFPHLVLNRRCVQETSSFTLLLPPLEIWGSRTEGSSQFESF